MKIYTFEKLYPFIHTTFRIFDPILDSLIRIYLHEQRSMAGVKELKKLLDTMDPVLHPGEFVFCSFPDTSLFEKLSLNPIGCFMEEEGLTLIISKESAHQHSIVYEGLFKLISLTVHSSLEAVGLTAAISTKLADHNISANVVAAYYHDHVFVPILDAQKALDALKA